MTRSKCEFPTEWSIYPDARQEDGERPPLEKTIKDLSVKTDETRMETRVFAAGASGPASQ
jgi:hypothetical protein